MGWLKTCEEHSTYSGGQPQILPRRLLDLSGGSVRLIDTNNTKPGSTRYITPSHCWRRPGSDPAPLRTTRETYQSRSDGIKWSDPPPPPLLFRDAILLTRGLGCLYIWIDSLCIVQGDEGDWLEQSALMADVYSNGYLNIAAAACDNSSQSLFFERE